MRDAAVHLPTQFLAPSTLSGLGREPEILPDILAPCSEKPGSHICDPERLLSGSAMDLQSEALRRLSEVKKVSQCPGMGYEVYVALLSVPPEEAHTAAAELGRRWGVLGGTEACGAVVVYAARERVLAVAADRALEENVLTAKVQMSVERSPFDSAEPASADAVIASLVGGLTAVLDGSVSKHYVLVQQGAEFFLYGISSIVGLVATGLLLFCLYDVMAHWFHAMRFHNCQNKVKRVHAAFENRQGELALCPYCVTSVSNQPSSSHVVFLCGHRFHMECANRWFAEEPLQSGRCAICAGGSWRKLVNIVEGEKLAERSATVASRPVEDVRSSCECCEKENPQEPDNEVVTEDTNADDEECNNSMNSWDEAKNFMLHSLHKEYPDIIQQDCLERWCSCHTEIWLSELRCPRYKSIFAKHSQK